MKSIRALPICLVLGWLAFGALPAVSAGELPYTLPILEVVPCNDATVQDCGEPPNNGGGGGLGAQDCFLGTGIIDGNSPPQVVGAARQCAAQGNVPLRFMMHWKYSEATGDAPLGSWVEDRWTYSFNVEWTQTIPEGVPEPFVGAGHVEEDDPFDTDEKFMGWIPHDVKFRGPEIAAGVYAPAAFVGGFQLYAVHSTREGDLNCVGPENPACPPWNSQSSQLDARLPITVTWIPL